MELFDKQYVHFMWDDVLDGKEGFTADNIGLLREAVNDNSDYSRRSVCNSELDSFPFYSGLDGSRWKFFYHDPLYEYKRAYKNGKRVEFYISGGWRGVEDKCAWNDKYDYRIIDDEEEKKPLRLTWRQLAMWLAKGNGQAISPERFLLYSSNSYPMSQDELLLPDGWQVRRWDENEWHEPTMEYCFPEIV